MSYLVKIDPTLNKRRFYEIDIRPTLFCEWAVVRIYGRIGASQRELSPIECESVDQALSVAQRLVKKRLKRGYEEVSDGA